MRYPGGKGKIARIVRSLFPDDASLELWMSCSQLHYIEPFFGSGAIGIEVLQSLPPNATATIGDKDWWLMCYWKACQDAPHELCKRIRAYQTPSANDFYRFKEQDGDRNLDIVECGFRKLVLHQISFSGLGAMAGGPLGGKNQENPLYSVECRWSPEYEIQKVMKYHAVLKGVRVVSGDFEKTIGRAARNAFIYADPPYVDAGPELYKHSFSESDHVRLRDKLITGVAGWLVSYDDHPLIRRLYNGCYIQNVNVQYSVAKR